MDPCSKGNYSRYIWEASMAMEGLPEGIASPGRVPEQLLQAAPILKRRRRRNRGEIGKEESILGVSVTRGKYRRRGAPRGATGQPGGPLAWPRVGPRQGPFWSPCGGPPSAALVIPEASGSLIFYLIFPKILEHF